MNIIELSPGDLRDLLLVLAKVPNRVYMNDPAAHLVSTILKMREIDWVDKERQREIRVQEALRGVSK